MGAESLFSSVAFRQAYGDKGIMRLLITVGIGVLCGALAMEAHIGAAFDATRVGSLLAWLGSAFAASTIFSGIVWLAIKEHRDTKAVNAAKGEAATAIAQAATARTLYDERLALLAKNAAKNGVTLDLTTLEVTNNRRV